MDYQSIVQQGVDYIENNLRADITAEELARMAGFSVFHYYRLFQSFTGMPVMQFVLRRRLLHAVYQIRCGRTRLEAALDYGFDTYAGFYKAFRREFGCQPSQYIRAGRAKRPYRLNLQKEEHMEITVKQARKWLEHWNLQNETIADIVYETGNKNENACYVGNHYVLKYTANPGKMKVNLALANAMADVGLWAATPVETLDGQKFLTDGELTICLTQRLPGNRLSAGQLLMNEYEDGARFVGEVIGQLHLALEKIDLPLDDENLLGTVKDWALPKTREILSLDAAFCDRFMQQLEEYYPALPRQIIHRDPNPANIIREKEQWGFIDFELSQRNVRIFDPIYASTAVLSETFSHWDDQMGERWLRLYRNILWGYDAVNPLTDAEKKAAPLVLLANQMVCVAWFSTQEKYPEAYDVNKRMTRWLIDKLDELKIG